MAGLFRGNLNHLYSKGPFALHINPGKGMPSEKDDKVDMLIGVFNGKYKAHMYEEIIMVDAQMNSSDGSPIKGGSCEIDFILSEEKDEEVQFWIALCYLKFIPKGHGTFLDNARESAWQFFNDYRDRITAMKALLMI